MDWRFSSFLIFLLALLFGFSWTTPEQGWCGSKFVLDVLALNNKDGALSCAEFWINRYQTLIAGLFAVLAAVATIVITRQQARLAHISLLQGRVEIMRAHLAELDRLMKRVGDAPAVGNYFQNAIDQIKGQQLTIGLTSAETLLSVAAATIKNFSREIRSGITGKQVGQRVKSDFAALEDACEQVEDHEVCLYDLLGHYIYARDARTRGMPSVYVAASELSSEEWQSFIRAAGRYDTTLRHIVSWSIDLQSSIGVAIEKHEVLVAEFDRQIGL